MQYTIIKDDSVFGIDGIFYEINVSSLSNNIRAIQFTGNLGHIEFNDGQMNQEINSFDNYSFLVDLWNLENKKANKPNYWYVWNGSDWIEDFDLKAQEELKSELAKAETYLSRTDWYYARKAETGEDVPSDVVAKRIECREFIRSQG